MKAERRLRSETVSFSLKVGEDFIDDDGIDLAPVHHIDVQLAYTEEGILREIAFVTRGKIGQGMDLLLQDLGIKLSRAIQRRNPDTGEAQ